MNSDNKRYVCMDCYSINLLCEDCGNYSDYCLCGEDASYVCMSCGSITQVMDEETWLVEPDCRHDDGLILYCDVCEVYRKSVNSSWKWQVDKPFCDCKPEKSTECKRCGVERDTANDEWEWSDPLSYYSYKCRHYDHPVEFPDGVTVYASSLRDREDNEDAPDFGLYLDGGWTPSCLNYHLGWPDYGIPNRWELAATMIIDTYRKAAEGQWVEVGCLGGHGRTGTVLACMAVLAGVPAKQATQWVRTNYCPETVETEEQEWWVEWFSVFVFGGVTSKQPFPKWATKKEKKKIKRKSFSYEGFDWRTAKIFQAGYGKPQFEYGAVLSRSVRKHIPKNDDDVELVDVTLEPEGS